MSHMQCIEGIGFTLTSYCYRASVHVTYLWACYTVTWTRNSEEAEVEVYIHVVGEGMGGPWKYVHVLVC